MKVVVTVAIALAVMMVSFALAQNVGLDDRGNPNDPFVNERANACYEGGSLEGRCRTDLAWNAGWYLMRFERGIFTREQIPSQYAWILPPTGGDDSSSEESQQIATLTSVPFATSTSTPSFPSSTPISTNTPTNTPTTAASTSTNTPTLTWTSAPPTLTETPTASPTTVPPTPTDTPTATSTS